MLVRLQTDSRFLQYQINIRGTGENRRLEVFRKW